MKGVDHFALRPTAQSGQFQARLDKVLGIRSDRASYLRLPVPLHTKWDVERRVHELPVVAPQEALEKE
eukprot:2319988-Alexandrium_andersonii.AAC.1